MESARFLHRAEVRSPPVVVDPTHPVGQVPIAASASQQLGQPSMDVEGFGQKIQWHLRVHHAKEQACPALQPWPKF